MNRAERRLQPKLARHKQRLHINPAAALNPVLLSTPLTQEETVTMKLQVREAFESIRTGTGSLDQFDHLCISYNAWRVLAGRIDRRIVSMMEPAGQALKRAKLRVLEGKSLLWDGEGLEPLRQFMDVYDEIIDHVSPRQVHDAIFKAHQLATGKKLNWRMK